MRTCILAVCALGALGLAGCSDPSLTAPWPLHLPGLALAPSQPLPGLSLAPPKLFPGRSPTTPWSMNL